MKNFQIVDHHFFTSEYFPLTWICGSRQRVTTSSGWEFWLNISVVEWLIYLRGHLVWARLISVNIYLLRPRDDHDLQPQNNFLLDHGLKIETIPPPPPGYVDDIFLEPYCVPNYFQVVCRFPMHGQGHQRSSKYGTLYPYGCIRMFHITKSRLKPSTHGVMGWSWVS